MSLPSQLIWVVIFLSQTQTMFSLIKGLVNILLQNKGKARSKP